MPLRVLRAIALASALIGLAACALGAHAPANVRIGGVERRPPPAPVAAPNASPRIVAIWLSAATLAPLQRFYGTITTSTNVASVEMRTEDFSYNVPRRTFGEFAFDYVMPELPPPVRRHFTMWITARNAAGAAEAEGIRIWLK